MSQTPESPKVTGNMFLFRNPELLNKEEHGKLGVVRPERPCAFCENVRAIPLTVSEIPAAVKDYPVVFMSEKEPIPLAVVGIVDEVNLFVDDNGQWAEDKYIPGYVRRYPFAVAAESSGDRMAVVIDRGFDGLKEGADQPLFDDAGVPSENTEAAIEFCKNYERDRLMTEQFMKQIEPHKLVTGQTAQFTPQGQAEAQPFATYHGIDEKALAELPDEKYLELRKSGILPILYAQMMSMSNWRLLMQRRARKFNLTEDQVLQQASIN